MKPGSTFLKLFLDNLLVMAAVIALAGVFTYRQFDAKYQAETRQHQDRLAHAAAEHLRALWPLDQAGVDRVCKALFRDADIRVTVVAADGAVLGESDADPTRMSNHRTSDRPEILSALSGQAGRDERYSETRGVAFRYVALPLTYQGQVVAAVRLATPVKTIAEGETFIRDTILVSAALGAVSAVVGGLLASWMWYAPLRRITRTARQIASGDLSGRADMSGPGRLAELSAALNETRDSLGRHLGRIASQHQDFSAVLATLQEGVIATDERGRIVLMNQAAGELLSVQADQAVGQPLASVVRSLDILESQEHVMSEGGPVRRQFEIGPPAARRILDLRATSVPPGPSRIRCLLVMRDVTELALAGAMKAQFVANASHELRTPLATIRAAVDSLVAADPGDAPEAAKLVGILDRHVTRLEDMTKDLLDLHLAESAKVPLRLQEIPLGELAEWARGQFASAVQEKSLAFVTTAGQGEHAIRSDRKLLELILRNLLDNAIKFTPSGGKVECVLEPAGAGATIRVSDTGCGIRPEDRPRVFERFYQGDAARSGEGKGRGTGLGLAIVKHAAERLGARIDLQSRLGQGTTVTVSVP
ncbi:MAG: ATP-binding protein [Planctomycetota bacterium]|nr:ATP-binding protein [Planctomycetota bacterium]